jgi:4'-phosphopantetheinyl transferase
VGTVVETASALGTSTVHVYAADLDTVDAETDVLSDDELERADRFRFDRDRRRFVAARSALRRTLARYVDAGPAELSFQYGPYGKPDVPGAPVSFNVSHSGSCALFAFGPRFELGVDVEVLDHALVDDLLVARQFFSPREVEALRAHVPSARPRAFLRCWTRKEAFVKARGEGLNLPLQDFDVSFEMGEPPALLRTAWSDDEPEEWTLEDVSRLFPRVVSGLFPSAVAALAIRSRDIRIVPVGHIE